MWWCTSTQKQLVGKDIYKELHHVLSTKGIPKKVLLPLICTFLLLYEIKNLYRVVLFYQYISFLNNFPLIIKFYMMNISPFKTHKIQIFHQCDSQCDISGHCHRNSV